jgi:hypothetical protein
VLLATVGVTAGVFSYRIPDLDVVLLGESGHGFFLFYSAALPVVLLLFNSWLEQSGAILRLMVAGACMGVGAALAIRLGAAAFAPAPYVVFPLFGVLIEQTVADERAWLITNALVAALVAVAAFNTAGDDQEAPEE